MDKYSNLNTDNFLNNVRSYFNNKNVCCFTVDVEWSPEWAIEKTLDLFASYDVPLTPFITHDSPSIKNYFGTKEKTHYVGLHPNFLPGSSHGNNHTEVIDHVINLWPESRFFRSHSFYDNSRITHELVNRGFLFDSNLCLYLQPYSVPLLHQSGLIRFPVFWEEDIHWSRAQFEFKGSHLRRNLDMPGLQVFNVHPLSVALNIPNDKYYVDHKFLYQQKEMPEDFDKYYYKGKGTKNFLEEVIIYLKDENRQMKYLYDLFIEMFMLKV